MNATQKLLLAIFLPYSILILGMMAAFPGHGFLKYPQLAGMVALCLFVLAGEKPDWVHRWMAVGFVFMVAGDVVFIFPRNYMIGIGLYLLSYVFVVLALFRKGRPAAVQWLLLAALVLVFTGVAFNLLLPHATGGLLVAALVFSAILIAMCWTAFSTLRQPRFAPPAARLFAAGGFAILGSDVGVAYLVFDPAFSGYVLWLELWVRATFMAGWLLFTLALGQASPASDRASKSSPALAGEEGRGGR